MSIKNYKPEQIVTILRQIEVQMENRETASQACKEAGIHTQTYYRWRREYGRLKLEQAKRLGEPAGDGDLVGGDVVARDSGTHSFRQRPGIHRPVTAPVAGKSGDGNPVHRTRQPL